MSEEKPLDPQLDESFIKRLNEDKKEGDLKLDFSGDTLRNVISREIKMKDLNEKLIQSKQEKITVREVILTSELDFVNSIKQLKSVFKEELKAAIDKVNDLYNNEVIKLQQLYRSEVIGSKLLEMVRTVATEGWYLLMKDASVNLCKFYQPAYEVTIGISETKGIIYDYEDPVCHLKAIYVNILHNKISFSTINLASDGQHPNCEKATFGTACAGSLAGRPITLDDPDALLQLLNEISSTYERFYMDSSYYKPIGESTTRKDNTVWKTAM
ncbi:MAG: hypothetical protein PHN88_04610 [Ignavibacteria bacterium]|nr:hypothetical protein [Ignavibacteria bacterium]